MVMRVLLLSALLMATLSSCTMTEYPLTHTNPLDRIFDSGDFRLMLTGESPSSTTAKLTWGDVYDVTLKTSNPVTSDNLKINGTNAAQLLYKSGSPSTTDIAAVKTSTALGGYTMLYPLVAVGSSYSGTHTASSPNHRGTYIIQFSYSYKNSAGTTTTGILFSNFVVIE